MSNIDDLKRKSVSGVVSYTLRSALLYFVAIGSTALLSAYLDPEDFGIYFLVTAVIGVFTFLSDVGLAAALIQKKSEPTLTELRTTFTVQQLLALIIFGVILLLTPVWQKHSGLERQGLALLYALGFSFILASFKTIPSILLERKLRFHTLVIPQMIEQVVFYVITVWLAIKGFGITSFTVAVIFRSIAGLIAIYMLQPWKIGLSLSRKALKTLLRFGLKFQANDLLARLKDDLFIVVLKKFLTSAEMGFLGWAKRWSMFPYQFSVQNVNAITFPTFSRLQRDTRLIARGLELSVYFISMIILPILVGMSVLAQPLTVAITAYQKWQPALPSLYFFCINIGFAAIANPFISALNAMGKINTTLKLMIVMTIATWTLTPIAWYWYGFLGVAIVSALVAAMSLYSIIIFTKIVPIQLFKNIWVAIISSLVMGTVIMVAGHNISPTVGGLMIQFILGAIVFAVSVLVIGRKQLFTKLHFIFPKII